MNLEESNSYQDELESRDRKRRAVMLSIILCGVFIALLFVLIIIITYQDSITEKFYINGQQVKTINSSIYKEINGTTYIDVGKFSRLLGYTYTKGEYKKYNEDDDSCYLQNNFEIVTLSADDTSYNKYIDITGEGKIADVVVTAKTSSDVPENYLLSNPIVFQDGIIYVPLDSVSKMFNVQISWQEYRKYIFTLENRVAVAQKAIASRYTEMSGYYENLRAIIDDFVIVSNSSAGTKYYGLYSLKENDEIISLKYDEMTYIQNVGELYIKVENGTMGLLNTQGGTIIDPSEFENISLLDDDGENQLYLVQKGQEYGVVNRHGKTLIYAENDEIGLTENYISDFDLFEIRNPKVLFDACIPVKKDGKYGLVNKNGEQVLNLSYQGFGYKSTAASKTSGNEQSILLIPPSVGIKGIVVNYDDLYGIFDVTTEKLIIPCVYSKIYAITRSGKTTYYMEYNGASIELADYLEDNALANVDEDGNPIEAKLKGKELPKEEDGELIQTSVNETSAGTEDTENNSSIESQEQGNTTENQNVVSSESTGVIELN